MSDAEHLGAMKNLLKNAGLSFNPFTKDLGREGGSLIDGYFKELKNRELMGVVGS
ncbi:hypothetical protein [Pedosphaera parvula]|uniref:Uncharacterized protein n=1 Tax=Pedosphaera parvula (strain Ellin514) TaxID=320771 RepID=B9XI34_PEDPL|nr:hypothetical protein [Pedosphaera parvula]EEF60527.1 hypothetical protein Cflav_PD3497 [Pedosphaera parvula Ellin514]